MLYALDCDHSQRLSMPELATQEYAVGPTGHGETRRRRDGESDRGMGRSDISADFVLMDIHSPSRLWQMGKTNRRTHLIWWQLNLGLV
jgi:hypothetical protein